MRSLEIRTERIFNNLIKQNQKLAADFVLKQSKIVSSSLSPASSVQSSVSIVQLPEFSVQGSESNVQSSASRVQSPGSSVQLLRPGSRNSGMPYLFSLFYFYIGNFLLNITYIKNFYFKRLFVKMLQICFW